MCVTLMKALLWPLCLLIWVAVFTTVIDMSSHMLRDSASAGSESVENCSQEQWEGISLENCTAGRRRSWARPNSCIASSCGKMNQIKCLPTVCMSLFNHIMTVFLSASCSQCNCLFSPSNHFYWLFWPLLALENRYCALIYQRSVHWTISAGNAESNTPAHTCPAHP